MQFFAKTWNDPVPEAEWEVWYQDVFDRECPRQIEVSGRGLVNGLMRLWICHLSETVRPEGVEGFSRFNLWWKQSKQSIKIVGEWQGAIRLRRWIFGNNIRPQTDRIGRKDRHLLAQVAAMHAHLIAQAQTSEPILDAAARYERREFENHLAKGDLNVRIIQLTEEELMSTQKIADVIVKTADVQARILILEPEAATKWHYHSAVTDTMVCLEGCISVGLTNPKEQHILLPGQHCSIPPLRIHSVRNLRQEDSKYLLIQGIGQYDFISVEDEIV